MRIERVRKLILELMNMFSGHVGDYEDLKKNPFINEMIDEYYDAIMNEILVALTTAPKEKAPN